MPVLQQMPHIPDGRTVCQTTRSGQPDGQPGHPPTFIRGTNGIESLNYQLCKVTKAGGHFPGDDAVVKLLWLAIINIEDKRARERAAKREKGTKHAFTPTRLVEGQRAAGWREALNELAIAYPGRIR